MIRLPNSPSDTSLWLRNPDPGGFFDMSDDIKNWCKEVNIFAGGFITCHAWSRGDYWLLDGFYMVFEKPEDEMLFKLTWL
jgi:hypothetical protein